MTISPELIEATVASKAHGMGGVKNPYISFQELETLCEGNLILESCLSDFISLALRYAGTVCRFEQIITRGQESNEEGDREEIEKVRSTIHDSTIDSINILSRSLKANGLDSRWISTVSCSGRAGYGKFAILIAFEIARRK